MLIEIKEVIDNGDGTTTLVFEYDDEFVEFTKKQLNLESPTEEQISDYILQAIERDFENNKKD